MPFGECLAARDRCPRALGAPVTKGCPLMFFVIRQSGAFPSTSSLVSRYFGWRRDSQVARFGNHAETESLHALVLLIRWYTVCSRISLECGRFLCCHGRDRLEATLRSVEESAVYPGH